MGTDEDTVASDDNLEVTATDAADSSSTDVDPDVDGDDPDDQISSLPKRFAWGRAFAFCIVPVLALIVTVAAGFFKWESGKAHGTAVAAAESLQAAKDSTIAMLSYQPDTAEKTLHEARERLTGSFKDSYTSLTNDVVIPGAKQRQITAKATIPAAASISATPSHAEVLVCVDQTVTIGADPPSDTASSVKVALEKVGGRWLISGFDPV
ncbi:hypothetical protein H7I01_08505 [Mycobacterium palustre]|uniref:Twin-arginine translocation pathway signal n=2 Tax=Mycobacterium palustre TaxID=153971 RepID=A0A1X1Z8L8_9MYCO|nr:hypothetical protein [Mycobacterium palustre]MCV7100431.1 hypothetical protein [Mycobacterium palustre]ORW19753.1 hypothetical protein AWC19_16235 [Mycobacterium palustre]